MTRTPMLAKVHIAKKELALGDDDYRTLLARITGKASSRDCSEAELDRLLTEFKRLGWKPKTNGAASGARKSSKPHVRKVYALWGELDRAGALREGSRAALQSFVQRQTGVSSPEWLTAPQAKQVTEGLKAMLARHQAGTGT